MYLGSKGARSSIEEIADAYSISNNHLVKIVNRLGKLGFIKTVRGRGGGISLSRDPDHICVGDVVRQTENFKIVECFDRAQNTCPLNPTCLLKRTLHEATEAFLNVLDRHSLKDLLGTRKSQQSTSRKIL